jgi:uncharacterized protein (TIGR03790 family)
MISRATGFWLLFLMAALMVYGRGAVGQDLSAGNAASATRIDDNAVRAAVAPTQHSVAEVLVVYNVNSPTSKAVANYYAQKRGVHNAVAIACADSAVSTANETISIADYTSEIETPIANYLASHAGINFIVLTKGIPIRISGGNTGSRNEGSSGPLNPSVDSYLAAMGYAAIPSAQTISITGSGATGYGWLNRYWRSTAAFSHAAFGGYLVTRLDGYTLEDAEALVNRSLAADTVVAGSGHVLLDEQPSFGVDAVNPQPLAVTGNIPAESDYGSWNADLVKAGELMQQVHIPVELNMSPTFVGNESGLLAYFSWGSNDPNFTSQAYESLRFAPGSIGDTAVSTSGRTFLPTTGGQSLIADLIAHGITGVKGYVDEPLLQAIASPSFTLQRYVSGATLAESFYAGSRFVGWEDVVIGDPLCRVGNWVVRN